MSDKTSELDRRVPALRPHAMTRAEAAHIVELLVSRWPHPELDDTGLALEIDAIADTGLTAEQARLAIRHLLLGTHRWRPTAGQLAEITRPTRRLEFPAATPGPDWRSDPTARSDNKQAVAHLRSLLKSMWTGA